jgi:ABC-2 type transport system ATP-binding protein
MTALLEAEGLSKHYGRHQALSDCDVSIPANRVAGLVGPNGAGKTTLLQLAVGLRQPTAGSIRVLGRPPAVDAGQLARVGFVAQDTPTYPEPERRPAPGDGPGTQPWLGRRAGPLPDRAVPGPRCP